MRIVVLFALAACGAGPRYAGGPAPALPDAPPRVDRSGVRVHFPKVTVWEIDRTRLLLGGGEPIGESSIQIGPVRSATVKLASDDALAVGCGWTGASCELHDYDALRERGRPLVLDRIAELQQLAATAGATAIANTQCFIVGFKLWCEADAVRDLAPASTKPLADVVAHRWDMRISRWSMSGTFSGGLVGDTAVKGATIGIARDASEIAFHMLAPYDGKLAAIGVETLHGINRGGLSMRAGLSALYMTPLEAMSTDAALGIVPKLAVAYHFNQLVLFNTRIFVEARGGYTFVAGEDAARYLGGPSFELALGLRTF